MIKVGDPVRHRGEIRKVLSVVDDRYLVIEGVDNPEMVSRSEVELFTNLSDSEVQKAIGTVVPGFLRQFVYDQFSAGNQDVRDAVESAYRTLFSPKLVEDLQRLAKSYGPEGVALCAMQLSRMPGILEAFHFDAETPDSV